MSRSSTRQVSMLVWKKFPSTKNRNKRVPSYAKCCSLWSITFNLTENLWWDSRRVLFSNQLSCILIDKINQLDMICLIAYNVKYLKSISWCFFYWSVCTETYYIFNNSSGDKIMLLRWIVRFINLIENSRQYSVLWLPTVHCFPQNPTWNIIKLNY